MNRLEKIMRPNSIAVIGASRKEGSLGKMFLNAILRMNYTGTIYPINPKTDVIEGIKTYPSISDLPEKPDLAVILLSNKYVTQTLETLGTAGIKDIIVVSAGFREIGGQGIEREKELIAIANKYNMNLLGPNCMGIFNTEQSISFNGTFSPTLPKPGHVAYVSQSGALGVAVTELAARSDLGFSVFVSTGNKADISDSDILEFLQDDSNTHVITLYLESIGQPEAFRKICRSISPVKPILAIKAGRTESGFKAASSHTGALANPEHIVDGFLKQCGVVRCDTLEQMFDTARALSFQHLPRGPQVAIITNAGGPGILASDAIDAAGLNLAQLSEQTITKLAAILPEEAATGNPVDMIASADHETYRNVLEIIQKDENVDSILLVIVKPPVNTTPVEIIQNLEDLIHNCDKTIIPVLMADRDEVAGLEKFSELQLPLFSYPESAVNALAKMWEYHKIQQRFRKSEAMVVHPKMKETMIPGSGVGNKQVPATALFDLLKEYDIAFAPWITSPEIDDIINFHRTTSGKIVLKIANEQVIHKTDSGLLALGLKTEENIRDAFAEIYEKATRLLPPGIKPVFLAQEQLPASVELVLGGKKDPAFGQVIMVGIGGIFVEVLKDVSFRMAPVNALEAREMLSELRSQPLLNGFRGISAIDRDSFAYTIQQFSLLLAEHPEIIEMDLNPLIWSSKHNAALVVDVRATVE